MSLDIFDSKINHHKHNIYGFRSHDNCCAWSFELHVEGQQPLMLADTDLVWAMGQATPLASTCVSYF